MKEKTEKDYAIIINSKCIRVYTDLIRQSAISLKNDGKINDIDLNNIVWFLGRIDEKTNRLEELAE